MVALRLHALDDISFQSLEGNNTNTCSDIWVIFSEKNLFPEFLKHFYQTTGQDQVNIPYSKDFF